MLTDGILYPLKVLQSFRGYNLPLVRMHRLLSMIDDLYINSISQSRLFAERTPGIDSTSHRNRMEAKGYLFNMDYCNLLYAQNLNSKQLNQGMSEHRTKFPREQV